MKTIVFLLLSCFLFAQQEFLVNTTTDSTQRWPVVAMSSNGNYAVAWKSETNANLTNKSDIYIQFFNSNDAKSGLEMLVNTTTTGEQEKPAIAMSESGAKTVVVWTSHTNTTASYDIYGRIYSNGTPVSDEFLINTVTAHTQSNPSVAMHSTGEFIVTWDSWFQDGSDRGVYAQRFDATGTKVGLEFQVNGTTANSQTKPVVRYLGTDKILFVWESFVPSAGYDLYGRITNQDAIPVTDEFLINHHTTNSQWFNDVAVFDDGSFVVVWCSWEQDGDDGGIYYQRFNNNGTKSGGEFRVNKSTAYYQWLPKVRKISGQKFAVVWSSWKQDGDREGVFAIFIDENENRYTLESRVNTTTASFQWEPDFVITPAGELLAVWSTYGQFGEGYDIAARRFKPEIPLGVVNPTGYLHPSGSTTATFLVQALDTTQMTGNIYEISFDTTIVRDSLYATITDLTTSQIKLSLFPLNKGPNIVYTTPLFDGIAVEFNPVYKLSLDIEGSFFKSHSGSNLIFTTGPPTAGSRILAPIDVALVWGSTDTLPNGDYITPLDTALSITGIREVLTPFYAVNPASGTKINLLIKEPTAGKNKRWNIGEEIVFITPPPYQITPFNTHAQIASSKPAGNIIMPTIGDTNFVLTKRPVSADDTFRFTTAISSVVAGGMGNQYIPQHAVLSRNYPNPFNPATTISFTLPKSGKTVLTVYSVLGEQVAILVNEIKDAGTYKINFNAKNFASGVYIYSLRFENTILANKMIYLR